MLKGLAEDLAIKKAMLSARLRKRAEKQDRDRDRDREESSRRVGAGAGAGAGGSAKEGQEQEQYQHQHQSFGMERAEGKDSGHNRLSPHKLNPSLTSVEELVDAEANEALEIAALER